MIKTAAILMAIAIVLVTSVSVSAHNVTYKGTVVAVDKGSISVSVIDDKTKKAATMKFDFDKETKFFRGDKAVGVADAKIAKDDKVAVTIDHDVDPTFAIEIRLDVKKS
jgi:hypothetical protein